MDELIAKIAKVPLTQRILILVVAMVVVVVGCYFLAISPKQEEIEQLDKRIKTLDAQLYTKRNVARDLPRYRVEVERLKQRLQQALTLLPNEAEIPELLQKIAALVEQSDCEMKLFEPQSEVVEGFYARIPVKMTIEGNYHSVAVFFDKVSKLTRIVNVTNIKLKEEGSRNKKIVLQADFLATTFKFVERAAEAQGGTGFKGGAGAKPKAGG